MTETREDVVVAQSMEDHLTPEQRARRRTILRRLRNAVNKVRTALRIDRRPTTGEGEHLLPNRTAAVNVAGLTNKAEQVTGRIMMEDVTQRCEEVVQESLGRRPLTSVSSKQVHRRLLSAVDSTTLRMDFCQLVAADINVIAVAISGNMNVSRLTLRNSGLDDSSLEALTHGLFGVRQLESLDVQGNADVGPTGIKTFSRLLDSRYPADLTDKAHQLAKLTTGSSMIPTIRPSSLRCSLTHINFEACEGIGDAGAVHLSEALCYNASITKLNLRHCEIGVAGAVAIGEMLNTNYTLTSLNLSWNKLAFGGKLSGVEEIANSLLSNHQLKDLDLVGTGWATRASGSSRPASRRTRR